MKRFIAVVMTVLAAGLLFAASYTDNTYQKLADEYTAQAEAAMNAGEYDKSVELAQKAAENAELSKAYINMMLARKSADDEMAKAKNKIAWAESISADK